MVSLVKRPRRHPQEPITDVRSLQNPTSMLVENTCFQGILLPKAYGKDVNPNRFTPLSGQNLVISTRNDHKAMAPSPPSTSRPRQRSRTIDEHLPCGPQVWTIRRAQSKYHTSVASLTTPPHIVVAKTVPGEAEAQDGLVPTPELGKENTDGPTPLTTSRQSPRPKLGTPRRSYSVTDHEPVPPQQQASSGSLTLSTIPVELHYVIFDFLDPIDATCLGLTNSHFYAIHRLMHGTVLLSMRRDGPNELEWAWHLAGYPSLNRSRGGSTAAATTSVLLGANDRASLASLRVRGKGLCRKCGARRCELHKHIREWVPYTHEYCSIRDKFVPRPAEDAKTHCYMSNPRNTTRCGRHRVGKDEMTDC